MDGRSRSVAIGRRHPIRVLAKWPRGVGMDYSFIDFGLVAVLALVFANGFFVAAEFSLVTVRKTASTSWSPRDTAARALFGGR